MMKHIRLAMKELKARGCDVETVTKRSVGHIRLRVTRAEKTVLITASSSPRTEETAILQIVRDAERRLNLEPRK